MKENTSHCRSLYDYKAFPGMKAMLCVVLLGLGLSSSAYSANIQGPKRGVLDKLENGDAVRKRFLLREKRFAVGPVLGMTLNDAFSGSTLMGIQLDYHLTDAFSVGANSTYGLSGGSALGDRIEAARPGQTAQGTFTELYLLTSAEVSYRPLFGKVAIFERVAVSYDFHLLAGAGLAGLTGSEETQGFEPMGVLGVGMRIFIDQSMALCLQIRDHIYSSAENSVVNPLLFGTDEPQAEAELRNNFAFTLGYGFYFPREPRVSD